MANVELLDKVMDHIEKHPETWQQSNWGVEGKKETVDAPACGTAFCFAGHASVTFAGDTPVWETETQWLWDAKQRKDVEHTYRKLTKVIRSDTGEEQPVAHRARELLAISSDDSEVLFEGYNTLVMLCHYVDELKAGEPLSYFDEDDDDDDEATED